LDSRRVGTGPVTLESALSLGTEEDLRSACETWAAALDAPDMPDTDTARQLAAAFQHKLIRDFLFRDTITTHNGSFGDVMTGKFNGRPTGTG
jgi:hypothetical protein